MAGLQRSAVSFRRQGSSGLVWDDRLLSGELKQKEEQEQDQQQQQFQTQDNKLVGDDKDVIKPSRNVEPITIERTRSNGGANRGYRTGKVSPNIEPPSPKVSACGFCSAFGKPSKKQHRTRPGGKRRSR